VDIDQSSEAPENVICSALTSPGLSIYKDLKDAATGKWQGGVTSNWGVDDGAPSVALTDVVPEDVKAAAAAAEKDIADGKVVPPQTTELAK
jgi:basic membrane protein A